MKNIFIISGPAGSGKDAIIDGLAQQWPVCRVITTTTRAPRPGETEGNPYHFVSPPEFRAKMERGDFIEYSKNENDAWYGVTRAALLRASRAGHIGIWKVDWKGTKNIKRLFPEIPAIFISAPLTVLESRLRKRDGWMQNEQYFEERLAYAREWLKHTDIYDHTIENPEGGLKEAIDNTAAIIRQYQAA